jgi:SNF2 family DNA or RNA helicase
MELRPYQNEAADFLFATDRAMILAPVGAGKTAITLTALQDMIRHGHINRVLVLAPLRVVKKVWPVERPLWAINLTMSLAVGTPKQRLQALQANTHIVVTNYDNLQWLATQKLNFDAIVFDELTRLKNPSGARFKALAKVIDPMRVRWGLTGSFTSNGLEDVFGQCKIVDQSLLGRSKGAFMQEYFILMNKEYGEWIPRKGSLEKVMARIKPATFVLEPGEYSDKLPPLHVVEMRCDMDRKYYEKMKKDLVLEYNDAKIVAVNAAVVTGKLQQMASGFVYNSFTEALPTPGKFKTTKTPIWFSTHKFDMLDELLQENQHAPTIVAYTFQEELAELKRRYPKALTLDDHNAIERWNSGKVELLFAHPKSAGHGLNLQHGGSRLVFLSLPWSLELFEQMVGRLLRSGQKHDVWCYILMTNKTVDERIWAGLNDNRALSDIAIEELKCA